MKLDFGPHDRAACMNAQCREHFPPIPRGVSSARNPFTGDIMHTCAIGVPDPGHPLRTDTAHCGACYLPPTVPTDGRPVPHHPDQWCEDCRPDLAATVDRRQPAPGSPAATGHPDVPGRCGRPPEAKSRPEHSTGQAVKGEGATTFR